MKEKMNVLNKLKFPHIYQYQKLGKDETFEGRLFIEEHQNEIDSEYSEVMDVNRERYRLGGSEYIHNSLKLQVRINSSF